MSTRNAIRPLKADPQIGNFLGAPSFSLKHRVARALWNLLWLLLAAWTPAPLHHWRVFLLRLFRARVPYGAFVYGSARIWYPPNLIMHDCATLGPGVNCYCMAPIEIGAYAIVSQGAFLCTGTHDIHHPSFQIYALPIRIEANAWVCAEAFVGPGVTIAEGAVLSARGVAFQNLAAWSVFRGNPATKKSDRTPFERNV